MVRRVGAGGIEYRRKGIVRGWETTEICTPDPTEIGRYLRGSDYRTRVWISIHGTAYQYPSRRGGRVVARGEDVHTTVLANTEYGLINTERGNATIARNMEIFRNPDTGEYDIESYCIRTKPPL